MSIVADGTSSSLAGCALCAGDKMAAESAGCAAEFPACSGMAAESLSLSGIATPSYTSETMVLISVRSKAAAWRSSVR
ncbi:unnamed protein product [Lampetra planeri]